MATTTIANILIGLGLNAANFHAGMAGVGKSLGVIGGTLPRVASAFGTLGAAAAAVSGGGALGNWAELEVVQTRLRQAIENTGASFGTYKTRIEELEASGERFGFGNQSIIESFSLLVTQTGDVEEAFKRQKVAFDLSRATGLDLTTATRLLGKVTDENRNVLGRYGITVDKTATAEEVLAQVQTKVTGQAEAFTNTRVGQAERIKISVENAFSAIGGFIGQNIGVVASLSLGLDALKGHSADLLSIVKPLGVVAALGAAGVGAGLLGAKALSTIPGLGFLGEELDQIGTIVSKVGIGGLFEKLGEQIFGMGDKAAKAVDPTTVLANAMTTLDTATGKVVQGFTSILPENNILEQARQAAEAFGLSATDARGPLNDLRDILFGIQGLGAVDTMRALGEQTIANISKSARAKVDQLESLRTSAKDEMESVARFWQDEADRRADFLDRIAKKTAPVIETIDQLNKDLGPGFDQNRRKLQADAAKARLDEEIAQMQADEDKRVSRLRPPSTPTLDKLKGETFEEKLANLDADLGKARTAYDAFVQSMLAMLEEGVAQLTARVDAARSQVAARRMLEGEPAGSLVATPEQLAQAREDARKAEADRFIISELGQGQGAKQIGTAVSEALQGLKLVLSVGDETDLLSQWLKGIFDKANVQLRQGSGDAVLTAQ